jgi:hypothetical protein
VVIGDAGVFMVNTLTGKSCMSEENKGGLR